MHPTASDREEIDRTESAYRRGVHQALAFAERWLGQARDLADAKYALSLAVQQAHEYRYRRRHEQERLLLDRIDAVARPVPFRRNPDGSAPPTADAIRESCLTSFESWLGNGQTSNGDHAPATPAAPAPEPEPEPEPEPPPRPKGKGRKSGVV